MIEFKTRLEFWRFVQNVEYEIRVTDIRVTIYKEIWNKNEKIAVYKPK